MKKLLIGLPVVLIGLFIVLIPGILFGEIGLCIVASIFAIIAVSMLAHTIGEEILGKRK